MTPQPHRSKWTQEENTFLIESIKDNKSLEDVMKTISLRTEKAILKKVNELGYGYSFNKSQNSTYFKDNVKHKTRRCKNEIENVSINSDKIINTPIKLSIDSVAKIVAEEAYPDAKEQDIIDLQEDINMDIDMDIDIHIKSIDTLRGRIDTYEKIIDLYRESIDLYREDIDFYRERIHFYTEDINFYRERTYFHLEHIYLGLKGYGAL